MPRVYFTSLKTIERLAVKRRNVLEHTAEFRLVENIQNLMEASVNGLFEDVLILKNVLNLKSHIADNHRESKILHRTGPRICLAPLALGI